MKAEILSYGATLRSLYVPDASGRIGNVVRSFPDVETYISRRTYSGTTIGRYANRIAGGKFELDGVTYRISGTSSHGGRYGFDTKIFTVGRVRSGKTASVTLNMVSPDGDQGFPGALKLSVIYSLDERDRLSIIMRATTNKPTIVNLTNHSYFNLAGTGLVPDLSEHQLSVNANRYLVVSPNLLPSGEIRDVSGSAFDFRSARSLGKHMNHFRNELIAGRGYDHTFALNGGVTTKPKLALTLRDPHSGRKLTLFTTEPGLHLYTGVPGYVALEPQHYPDTPNHPHFPSVRLDPGRRFTHHTIYAFSAQKRLVMRSASFTH